jgi:hypothetical protein
MKQFCCLFMIVIALLVCVMFQVWEVKAVEAEKDRRANEYVLEVAGVMGVQLDMLLITKPSADANPERESERITVPFTRKFSGAKCYAWFDTLPNNGSGKEGNDYHIVLKRNGKPAAEVN